MSEQESTTQEASAADPAAQKKPVMPPEVLRTAVWEGSDEPHEPGGGRIEVAKVEFEGETYYLMRDGEKAENFAAGKEEEDSPVLVFNTAEWDAFVWGVKNGEFDLPMD